MTLPSDVVAPLFIHRVRLLQPSLRPSSVRPTARPSTGTEREREEECDGGGEDGIVSNLAQLLKGGRGVGVEAAVCLPSCDFLPSLLSFRENSSPSLQCSPSLGWMIPTGFLPFLRAFLWQRETEISVTQRRKRRHSDSVPRFEVAVKTVIGVWCTFPRLDAIMQIARKASGRRAGKGPKEGRAEGGDFTTMRS